MSESAHVFNLPRTAASSTENIHGGIDQLSALAEGSRRRQQSQQPRQLLSCTKCRERKVKVSIQQLTTSQAIPAFYLLTSDRVA